MAYLDVADLRSGYGRVQVLDGVTFSAERGAITAILGANGAGKTTTLRSLMGANAAWGGRISVDGVDVTTWSTEHRIRNAGLAMVPEGRQLFPELTVQENLSMGAYVAPRSRKRDRDLIAELAAEFPVIKAKLKHKANALSGGEQQIVAIARALMSRPKLLLADEVSQGISPILTLQLWSVFRKLAQAGTAVVLVEQNVSAALKIADRAALMKAGKVVQEGSAADLASNEKIRLAYLG
jgi:branched-chain amino acid transport system ATP-binding protein